MTLTSEEDDPRETQLQVPARLKAYLLRVHPRLFGMVPTLQFAENSCVTEAARQARKKRHIKGLDAINAQLIYHRFDSDRLSQHYGNEWDALVAEMKERRISSIEANGMITDGTCVTKQGSISVCSIIFSYTSTSCSAGEYCSSFSRCTLCAE